MKVYSKYNLNFNKYTVGKYIADKADGEVFESGNDVIKFVEISDSKKRALNAFNTIRNNINYIIDNNPSHIVNVIDFGCVKVFEDKYSIIYFYVMEKLFEISNEEKNIFNEIFTEDGISLKGDFNYNKKIIDFANQVNSSNIEHLDVIGNVMKDKFGNYKFIDLERVKINVY